MKERRNPTVHTDSAIKVTKPTMCVAFLFCETVVDLQLYLKLPCDSSGYLNSPFLPSLSRPQLLCLVGEAFDEYSDHVCGAVVNIRTKGDKIAVWTADYDNREAVTHIGWDGSLVPVESIWTTGGDDLYILICCHFPQQESVQGAPGASHEDDHWLPVPLRHSHQERLNHQEQICCLSNALCAPLIFLSYLLLVHMFTLLQRLCGMQSWGKETQTVTTSQMFP